MLAVRLAAKKSGMAMPCYDTIALVALAIMVDQGLVVMLSWALQVRHRGRVSGLKLTRTP